MKFSHLGMEDGLSNNSVYCMMRDSDGYIWFGTFSGLNRYDGQHVTIFRPETDVSDSINGSVIFSILEDGERNIWVGTDGGGLNLFNRETLSFSSFRNDPDDPSSLPSNQVFALEEDLDGELWIGTAGGGLALKDKGGNFVNFNSRNSGLIHDRIRKLHCDEKGILWVGTERGLSRYDTQSGHFLNSSKAEAALEGKFIRDFYSDAGGTLWIGTTEGLYAWKNNRLIPIAMPDELAVRVLTSDGERLWVGTERSGLLIYSYSDNRWFWLREKDSPLSHDKIRSLYKDPDGLVWIGTRGGGVNLYNPASSQIRRYTADDEEGFALKNPHVRQIIERKDGSIWIGTDGGGISVLDRQSSEIAWKDVDDRDTLTENDQVYSLMEDSLGALWIGTDGAGLYRLPPGTSDISRAEAIAMTNSSDSPHRHGKLSRDTIWALFEDTSGDIWVGTENRGLFRFRNGKWTQYNHSPGETGRLNGTAVRCVFEDSKGHLWIGTWDGGLNRFNKDSEDFTSFVRSPGFPGSLSDNSVNVIFEDSLRRLWIGTAGGGINIYQPESQIFRSINTKNGLSGDNIYGILEDGSGNIWVSTDFGLSRISLRSETIRNLSRADGLNTAECSEKAYLKTADGTLFFGGPRGISSFHPEKLELGRSSHSSIRVTGLDIHNLPVEIGQEIEGVTVLEKDISLKQNLVLPPSANNLTIRFSILSYIDPEKHHFSVQLLGLDDHPHFLGNRNEMSYASIPPGKYELEISGTDHNGQNLTRILGIRILKPFWMKPWFIASSVLFIFLMGTLIVWLRLRRLERNNAQLRSFTMHMEKAREEERKSAAREYHDELGQLLTAVKFDLFWLNSHPEEKEEVRKEKIASLLEIINEAINSVRTLSTNLRPKALDNLSLEEALEWQSRKFRKRTGIALDLQVNLEKGTVYDEDVDRKTALFRMYQEVLTNIIRHAEASMVSVKLHSDGSSVYLIIRDNGKGIEKSSLKRDDSFGLIGMRERCLHLQGSFHIDNHPEGGTMVRIVLPLKG